MQVVLGLGLGINNEQKNNDMSIEISSLKGRVITVRGPVKPSVLGRVMMHEHLHCDIYDWEKHELITEEKPITQQRRELLMKEAVPYLRKCNDYGCHAYVDVDMPPYRAWPTFYAEASREANIHIILCTGSYCEVEVGYYWAKKPEDTIWPFVRKASVEELADYFVREITEGIHGTEVHAGAIKLGSFQPQMTTAEKKAFLAGARAQKETGVTITTHCTRIGAETSQLQIFVDESVDLDRVVVGHTARHLMNPESRKICMEWMERGANFLPTNLFILEDRDYWIHARAHSSYWYHWRPLVEAIHEIFDAGLGDKIVLGLDWSFDSVEGPFPTIWGSPPPYLHMFTHTLPAFRKMGLTDEEEEAIMVKNPQRILPIQ